MRLSKIHPNTFYRVPEAAELLEYSPHTIAQALRSGRLIGYKPAGNGNWQIKGSDLMDFVLQSAQKSRPKLPKHD